jgi:hypothetical protein
VIFTAIQETLNWRRGLLDRQENLCLITAETGTNMLSFLQLIPPLILFVLFVVPCVVVTEASIKDRLLPRFTFREGVALVSMPVFVIVEFGVIHYDLPECLISGEIPINHSLFFMYGIYVGLTILYAHILFFVSAEALKIIQPVHAKRMPKYVDYVASAFLMVSLFQVLTGGNKFKDFVQYSFGTPEALTADIQHGAAIEFDENCQNKPVEISDTSRFYTPAYCAKLKAIAVASDGKEYLAKTVVNDKEFLDHAIFYGVVSGDTPEEDKSPLIPLIKRLNAVVKYGDTSDKLGESIFGWVALLLLPVGIALRIVKTSLELFGKLEVKQ